MSQFIQLYGNCDIVKSFMRFSGSDLWIIIDKRELLIQICYIHTILGIKNENKIVVSGQVLAINNTKGFYLEVQHAFKTKH